MRDIPAYDRTVAHDQDVDRYRHPYPHFDYEARIAALATRVADEGLDGALLPYHIDCTYFTGCGQPMTLWVPADRPTDARVFVRRAMGFAKQEVELPADQVQAGGLGDLSDYVGDVDRVGTPRDVIPASLDDRLAAALGAETENVSEVVLALRARKDPAEVDLIETGAGLFEYAHQGITERAAPGVTEREVSASVARRLLEGGMDDHVNFRRWSWRLPASGLIASGDALGLISGHAMTVTGPGSSRSMPWGPSNRRLEEGDFLVADLVLNWAGYHGDVARTYVVGEPTAAQQEWFDATLAIHEAARDAIEPGVAAEDPYLAAREAAEERGVADWLCGYAEMQAPYIGHSIGLEADEEPTLMRGNETELAPGMVLTIEPKLMHPDRGSAMIEDDYLVTEGGVERLSSMPQRLFSIDY